MKEEGGGGGRGGERGGLTDVSCRLQIPRRYGTFPWASKEGRTGTRPYQKSDQTVTCIVVTAKVHIFQLKYLVFSVCFLYVSFPVFYLLHFPDFKVMPLFLVFGRLLLSYKSSHLNFCFLFILKFLYPIFLLNHMNTSVPLQPLSFFISNTLYSSLILYVGISPGLSSGERAINHATCHCVKC